MINAIMKKEWLKIKVYFIFLISIVVVTQGNFLFEMNFSFSTIEPESMLWYKFVHLHDKPYFYGVYLYLFIGLLISIVQFLPEKMNKRIKIMAHLPLSLRDSLFIHLFIGMLFIAIVCTVLSVSILLIMIEYYPEIIIQTTFKDTVIYSLLSMIVYLGISSIILEKKLFVLVIKFIFMAVIIFSFLKEQYSYFDFVLVAFLLFMPFLVLDSFYSIKEQRLNSLYFKLSFILISLVLLYSSYVNYHKNYQHEFNKYYIFYSNVIDDFVYQKNYGKHHFEYGVKDSKTFPRVEYESYLPFVYWRNLDIQGKLPLSIKEKVFDKNSIKNSRLGFSYHPVDLEKLEVELYPLFNPLSHKGMIPFPEEMFTITSIGSFVYNFDDGIASDLSDELNVKLNEKEFTYPASHVWGKPTNMKPFDKGYLVLDDNKKLFNIKRENNNITVENIPYPKDIELAFIKISENKQKKLSGYAIDTKSNFYLLDWDFKFYKIDLPHFDYKSMKLKLISNPINYIIRYDNGSQYHAVALTQENGYKQIKYIEMN